MMKKTKAKNLFGALAVMTIGLSAGTASAANIGPDQELLISTSPEVTSHCILRNDTSAWTVDDTPAHVNFLKAGKGFDIECYSNDGQWHGATHAEAKFSGQSLLGFVYGSISNGADIFSGGSNDGAGMKGFWTQTKGTTVMVPMTKMTQTHPEAALVDNDEAYQAIPKSDPKTRPHHGHKTVRKTVNNCNTDNGIPKVNCPIDIYQ